MTILFVTTDYIKKGHPATGLPTYLYRVSQGLISMGHTPIILVTGREDSYKKRDGVEIYSIFVQERLYQNPCINYLHKSCMRAWLVNKKIKELVKNRKIDMIQFASLNGLGMFYCGKVPAVLRLSSYAKTYFHTYATYDKTLVGAMSFVERAAAKRCNAVFAPCHNTAQAFESDIKRKVYTIESPFVEDVHLYDNKYLDQIPQDKKYALFFGTLYAEKGIKEISACLENFLEKNQNYCFVFAGRVEKIEGEYASELIKRSAGQYRDRVLLLPEMKHEYLYPIIKSADFVVLPSLMDNFPNACVEAMYFGKIVIGTNGASFEQLIDSEKSGYLCKIGDSEDLLKKMQRVVELDKTKRSEIERNAQLRIELLRPERVVKKLLRFYQYVIDNSK